MGDLEISSRRLKAMKNIGLILFTGFIMAIGILKIQQSYSIKENVLYQQADLKIKDETNRNNNELITRSEAIEMVKDIFYEGLGINLWENQLEMHINLYKDVQNCYRWNMNWTSRDLTQTYTCYMDSHSGRILYIYAGQNGLEAQDEFGSIHLSEEEIRHILEPFAKAMNISLSDYILNHNWQGQYKGMNQRYQNYEFRNKEHPNVGFIVEIDTRTRNLREYEYKELE